MKIFKLLFAVALSQVDEEQVDSARPVRKYKVETSFDKVRFINKFPKLHKVWNINQNFRIQLMANELATTIH